MMKRQYDDAQAHYIEARVTLEELEPDGQQMYILLNNYGHLLNSMGE